MAVLLTSFIKSREFVGKFKMYSVSRFQPKGFNYPELTFLAAKGPNNEKLLLRDFGNPLVGYKKALFAGFSARRSQVKKWLNSLDNDVDIALVCWCPYSSATKKQLQRYGTFACHTGLIARVINKHRQDIRVLLDRDHALLVPEWMPKDFTVIDIKHSYSPKTLWDRYE